jgi:hypothetical protein
MKNKLHELNLEEIREVSGGGNKEVSVKEAIAGVFGTVVGLAAFHFIIDPIINSIKNFSNKDYDKFNQ